MSILIKTGVGRSKLIKDSLDEYGVKNYTINDDFTIDVNGDVNLEGKDISEFPVHIQFGTIKGDFDCSFNQLTSLKGVPKKIEGNFDCNFNQLTICSDDALPIEVTKNVFCIDAFKKLPASLEKIFHVQQGKVYTKLDLSLLDEINQFPWQALSTASNNQYDCLGDLAKTLDIELDDNNTPTSTRIEKVAKSEFEEIQRKLNEDCDLRIPYTEDGDTYIITHSFLILGEYIRTGKRPKVILYTKAIKKEAAKTPHCSLINLFQLVYVHEMMHAFYDYDHSLPNKYISYIEEPLTEYAMLRFMTDYQSGKLTDYAISFVQEKQKSPAICFYGFGAYLYNHFNKLRIDGMSLYRNAKYRIEESDEQVKEYTKEFRYGIYPFNRELKKASQLLNIAVSVEYPLL
ncbi:MAG: hypothetical protein MSH41_07115 [Bacteroidales bacterium]|nr:hypothetical protein [Bacteroidales bacterium]